ncbi:host specificity factor TipJ family phage tail protein [Tateyamaria sp.]|uniref:host specificity factor TipJ family phage tail protein n=1 Tax=Tateyamaria sp. TaxID=1929288 RepID=UPI003B22459C
MTSTALTVWPHPVTSDGRQTLPVTLDGATTAADLARTHMGGVHEDEVRVVLDGEVLPPEDHHLPVPQRTRQVVIWCQPGRDILRTIALVAIAALAPQLFPALTGPALALASGAVVAAGGLLVNALIPIRAPDLGGVGNVPVEPTFSLAGGANGVRLYEPLPLVLGRHRMFPDLAAAAYTEFVDDQQLLNQTFHFGLGDLDVDNLMAGSSELAAYEGVTSQIARGGRVTIFAGNVDTITGAVLERTDWVTRETAANTNSIAIDLVGDLVGIDDRGEFLARAVDVDIQWRRRGPNSPGWVNRTVTIRNDSRSPVRRTIRLNIGDGRWEVRVRRLSEPREGTRERDEIQFAALRAYQPDTGDYTGQTRLALRIQASGQLSGRLDRLSATVHQKVPVYRNGSWTGGNARSSNPAAIFRWYARGIFLRGRLAAGVGLARARIDDDVLAAWYLWCEAQGLACDLVLQSATTHDEVLGTIAQCGRAAMTWATGRLGVVYDEAGVDVTGLVTPGSILEGSFKVDWPPGGLADEIVVRFVDPENDWQYSSVRRPRPGLAGTPVTSSTITARGITSRDHAAMECNLAAARQHYHRRRYTWEMSHEGRAFMKGDVVMITHSLIDGGMVGRAVRLSGTGITLDRAVDVGAEAWLALRRTDGRVHMSRVDRAASGRGPTRDLRLRKRLEGPEDTEPQDVLWRLYDTGVPPRKVRITGVEPVDDRRFKFTGIDEVDEYHAAATSDLSLPLPDIMRQTPRVVTLSLTENLVRVSAGYAVELEAVLTVAGDWRGGIITMAIDDGPATTVATLTNGATRARWPAPGNGNATITVVPGSEISAAGRAFVQPYTIRGADFPPGHPTNFLIDVLGDGTRRLRWTPPDAPHLAGVVIRYFPPAAGTPPEWDNMTRLHSGLLTASPLETVEPAQGAWTFVARAIDTNGNLSERDTRIKAEIGPQRQGDAILWRCPSAQGWPGTSQGARPSNDGRDALEGGGVYTWSDLDTWSTWVSWGAGAGDEGARFMAYTPPPEDLQTEVVFALQWSGETEGAVTVQARIGATRAALLRAAWVDHAAGTTLTARWVQVRWRLRGDGSELLSLDHLCWSIIAPSATRRLLDRNTAQWAGSAASGREVPHDLALVTDVDVTLQSVGAGWTWSLASKSPLRIKIFDGQGNPADAVVDIIVRGIAA